MGSERREILDVSRSIFLINSDAAVELPTAMQNILETPSSLSLLNCLMKPGMCFSAQTWPQLGRPKMTALSPCVCGRRRRRRGALEGERDEIASVRDCQWKVV